MFATGVYSIKRGEGEGEGEGKGMGKGTKNTIGKNLGAEMIYVNKGCSQNANIRVID